MDAASPKKAAVPFSMRGAPSLIERVWPAQKISVEVQKERKAGQGQTLTGLGSYWKGRKPLFLVEACVLGALLPATGNDANDLAIFELLLGMRDDQVIERIKSGLSIQEIKKYGTAAQIDALIEIVDDNGQKRERIRRIPLSERNALMDGIYRLMPYAERIASLLRPEEVEVAKLVDARLREVNEHLGTHASTLTELVAELGVMRFGRQPKVADTFCGGGSIPYAAARLGCDVYASDLNPVAAMLTWGSLNVVGGADPTLADAQDILAKTVDEEITRLGIEHDELGNRAKAYLYCLEVRCPQTQWLVPLLPTLIISKKRRVVARLIPNQKQRRFDIVIAENVPDEELKSAEVGTIRSGSLSYELDGEMYVTSIKALRGDRRDAKGASSNALRPWTLQDFYPDPKDVFQERLYCIQWITKESVKKTRQVTYFAAPTENDEVREEQVRRHLRKHLSDWQQRGWIPDMPISPGQETARLIRERGWTHWHHLFPPRHLLLLGIIRARMTRPELILDFCQMLNITSKMCMINSSAGQGGAVKYDHVFHNQALNTFWNYGVRGALSVLKSGRLTAPSFALRGDNTVKTHDAKLIETPADIFVTDPPYADAVNYHEITEYFIAWLRKELPAPLDTFIWDSRRPLAIKGDGEEFRHGMVSAYGAMAAKMPDNGVQIVMFTHQSAAVWADMAQIFWGAGLQVMAAWYIATETTSELKKGGYVQGTVILVLRKRKAAETGYKDEIVQEVRVEVADQIETMLGLNQQMKGHGRIENLFEDSDLQMAGYAAALRVLTRYERIDGVDMTKEALRPRRSGEKNVVGEIIDFAVQVANEHMIPENMQSKLWEALSGPERFYFKMMDIETTSLRKLDNYQNFAKAFRVGDYGSLMGSLEQNKARLKTAKEFKKSGFEIPEFGPSATRAVLYAIYELENEGEGDEVLAHLRDMLPSYHSKRDDVAAIAEYIARKREKVDETESRAARILHGLIRNERLG